MKTFVVCVFVVNFLTSNCPFQSGGGNVIDGANKLHGGLPGGSAWENVPAGTEDTSSIPGSGKSPGEGNGNPLQYSCLGNPMDRGAWWASVPGVTRSRTRLSN